MTNSPRYLLALLPLLLVACGPAEDAEGETVSVDPAEVGYGTEADTSAENELAIEPGLYVIDGSDCADPANTGHRVWTGQGLEASATKGCTFQVESREGEVYQGRQSCAGSSATALSIEVLEPGSIVVTEGEESVHMTLCPEGEGPAWVEERMQGQ